MCGVSALCLAQRKHSMAVTHTAALRIRGYRSGACCKEAGEDRMTSDISLEASCILGWQTGRDTPPCLT